MAEGAVSESRSRALSASRRVHAPIRTTAVAVLALAVVSAISFPTVGGARTPDPPVMRAAVLTPDGTDGYVFDAVGASVNVSTNAKNSGGNLRTVFWSSAALRQRDALTCATWSAESSDKLQQGAAVRISPQAGGGVRAITVTKNVYPYGSWIFNVHVWDSASGRFDGLASIVLRDALSVDGDPPLPRPLPWRVCARAVGRRFSFKAWPAAVAEPAWGDARYGASVPLPASAPTDGYAGWYIGHLQPGMTATYSAMSTAEVSPSPSPTDALAALGR